MSNDICKHGVPLRWPSQYSIDQCRACWIDAGGDYRAPIVPFEVPCTIVLPYAEFPTAVCAHRGERLPTEQVVKLELNLLREWYPCAKGHGQNGYICPCQGCGPTCKDYLIPVDDV